MNLNHFEQSLLARSHDIITLTPVNTQRRPFHLSRHSHKLKLEFILEAASNLSWSPSSCSSVRDATLHVEVVLDDLEHLWRLRDPTRLQLGPHRHPVQGYLECARGYELRLDGVGEEEDHEARVHLVLDQPRVPTRRWLPQELEGVEAPQDEHYQQDLAQAQNLRGLKPPPWRVEVVSLDGQLRVFVLQYSGILLKYLPVPSGIAVQELDGGSRHHGGVLGRGDLLGDGLRPGHPGGGRRRAEVGDHSQQGQHDGQARQEVPGGPVGGGVGRVRHLDRAGIRFLGVPL